MLNKTIAQTMKKITFLIFILFQFQNIFAEGNLTVQYSDKTIEVGEQWFVVFEVRNLNLKDIKFPNLGNFKQVSGPQTSQSTQMSNINGKISRSVTLSITYSFINQKIGKQTFPKCQFIMQEGQIIESQPIPIEVVKAGSKPRQQVQQPDPMDPFASFFDPYDPFGSMMPPQRNSNRNQQAQNQNAAPRNIDLKKDIFARIVLDKNKVYIGEQINASVKIYTSVNSMNFEAEKVPNFNGFWSQDIKLPEKLELKKEIINGKEFVVVEIKKMILFPTKAGILEITPLNMKTTALVPVQVNTPQRNQRQPRDLFELMQMQMEEMMRGGFNPIEYKQIEHKFTSGTVKVEVLPLPEDAPKSFSGAVGQYQFETFSNKKNLKTDEALEFTLAINGKGNLPLFDKPNHEWTEDFEVFDPALSEIYESNPIFKGNKNWKYTIIPHMPGNFKTPDVEFSYFDPNQKKYITIKSESIEFTVTGKPTPFKGNDKNLAKSKKTFTDINSKIERNAEPISFNTFILASSIPGILFLLSIFLTSKKSDKSISDKEIQKKLQAHLKEAKKYLDADQKSQYYNEMTHSIWQYISLKLKINTSELNRENISEKLISRGVPKTSVVSFIELIDDCEMGLYTQNDQQQLESNYNKAILVLSEIEQNII